MTGALLWAFVGQYWQWIAGGLFAALVAFQQRRAGAKSAETKQRAKEADALEQHFKDVAGAANAGRGRLPDIANDPANRDNQKR